MDFANRPTGRDVRRPAAAQTFTEGQIDYLQDEKEDFPKIGDVGNGQREIRRGFEHMPGYRGFWEKINQMCIK